MDTNTNITTTPTKRGYWAGFKDVKQFGRLFWFLVGITVAFGICAMSFKNIQFFLLGYFSGADKVHFMELQANFPYSLIGVILFGSVADWLGIRRAMLSLFGLLSLICILFWGYLLVHGEPISVYLWVAFFFGNMTLLKCWGAIEYQGIKRYVDSNLLLPAIIMFDIVIVFISIVSASYFGIVAFAQKSMLEYSIPPALIILFITAWIVLKKFKPIIPVGSDEDQSVIAKPNSPFSGFFEVIKNKDVKRVIALAAVVMLLPFGILGLTWIFENHPYQFMYVSSSMSNVPIVLLFLSIPFLKLISISSTIKVSAILILVSNLLLVIPTTGVAFDICVGGGLILLSVGWQFILVRIMEYALRSSPYGREGSVAAVLGVVWLLSDFAHTGVSSLIESQKHADWTYAFTQAINTDASNVHALWLITLVPVALGTILLFVFNRYLFDEVV